MRTPFRLLAALTIFAPVVAAAQVAASNPLIETAHAIASSGLGSESGGPDTKFVFAPVKERLLVHEFAAHLGKDATKQAEIERGILDFLDVYEKSMRQAGQANDVATALAFSVAELYAVQHGREIDGTAFKALVPRIRAALAKVQANDRQKQEFYEYALSCAGAVLTMSVSEDASVKAKAPEAAGLFLEALVGAKPDAVVLDGESVRIGGMEPVVTSVKAMGGSVVGEWRWTSTGSMTNWNAATGVYAGAGRGMTKHYVFKADGTFTEDSLIQVNNGGHRTSAYITAEGRYTLKDNKISFTILKGRTRGEDNMISAGNYDKPMPEETMRRTSETLPYSVRKVDSALCFILHLGNEAKSDMVFRALTK